MRQDGVDVGCRLSVYPQQDVPEVGERIDVVQVAGRDQRVEAGEVLAAVWVADEHEVRAGAAGAAEAITRTGTSDTLVFRSSRSL